MYQRKSNVKHIFTEQSLISRVWKGSSILLVIKKCLSHVEQCTFSASIMLQLVLVRVRVDGYTIKLQNLQ